MGCSSSSPVPATYTVTICFSSPVADSRLSGDTTVKTTIKVTGSFPGTQRMIFYLDDTYLLTDYESPYTFILPTTMWMDGSHTLSVEALMRDTFTTQRASLSVNFSNGITSPPINTNQFLPTTGRPAAPGTPFLVAAGGDGASGEAYADKVSDLITSLNPNLFLYLGDVYEKGGMAEFYNWYGTQTTNFGRLRPVTNPTIGNHEYENGAATGYFDYWNNIPNYYSYNAGGWHFISLNSNSTFQATDHLSAQYKWLQDDLSANANSCTVVYYHHPLFNIGPEGPTHSLRDIWKLMAQYGVDIVVNGHDHDYQRWVPLGGNGQRNSNGITEFVVGSSGHGLQTFTKTDSRVAYSIDTNPTAFGVLLLQLNQNGANFRYLNGDGSILDSGVIPCVPGATDTLAPTIPTGLSATTTSATQVNLSWSASNDVTGVAGYTIYRNTSSIATVSSASLTYIDKTALPQTSYSYAVAAFDPAGNHSEKTTPVAVTMPPMPDSLAFPVIADSYVSASTPASKFGTTTFLRLDSSPDLHSYLRFKIHDLAGTPIARARLLLYAKNNGSQGVSARAVSNNSWDEAIMTYANAPVLGATIASSGAFTGGRWVELDVTSYITGEGTYNFGLTTPGLAALSFPSREAGLNAPELILDFQSKEPDIKAPSVPTGLTAIASSSTQVNLNWTAASDNIGVTGYKINRNGAILTTVPGTSTSYSDTTVVPNTTYSYSIEAYDKAGNHSAATATVAVTTPDLPPSLVFTPVADTYVNAGNQTVNFGKVTALRVSSSPDLHSYLRFVVQGLGGRAITRAQLLVFANSNGKQGINAFSVANNVWGELTTNYTNAPTLGSVLMTSTPFITGKWVKLDVTSYITGEGTYSFGITTSGTTAINLSSRESGTNAPQLIIDLHR